MNKHKNWLKVAFAVIIAIVITIPALLLYSGSTVYNPLALGNASDLTTPSSTQDYPLGYIVEINDETNAVVNKYMYVTGKSGDTAVNSVVVIDLSSTAGAELIIAQPASTSVDRWYGVTNVVFTADYYGFVQIQGYTTVITTGAVTAGKYFKALNGALTVHQEDTISVKTLGAFIASNASATTVAVILFGREAQL